MNENEYSKADRIWNVGNEVGFSFLGEGDVVIGQLKVMEVRDKSAGRREEISRVENSLSNE